MQIYFFVFDAEFASNVFSVKTNGAVGQIQHTGDLFGGFTLFDKIRYLNLGRCQIKIFRGQPH